MRIVLQRVSKASVVIEDKKVASIKNGLLVLLGIVDDDSQDDIDWLCNKIVNMRIFPDEKGIMNNSILESKGDIILVSQFTLHASTKKGNRPSYIKAAKPDIAIPLYEKFIDKLQQELGKPIQTGQFGADMKVKLINDGPVTVIVDSKQKE
jgi:D-tyrosyl-tRNA(Tyr) deacylase